MKLQAISALNDNYIWLLSQQERTIIVDPGDAAPVICSLREHHLHPIAILLTHHHDDHTDGVAALLQQYPDIAIYAPEEVRQKLASLPVQLATPTLTIASFVFDVLPVPGHTNNHVAYYCKPYLFCGDTLFAGGCGRIFEGTTEQMYKSITLLNTLPGDTYLCPGHEYTVDNLIFAQHILPSDVAVNDALTNARALRTQHKPTLPTRLDQERKSNLFLRCNTAPLMEHLGETLADWQRFALLRKKKDLFNLKNN